MPFVFLRSPPKAEPIKPNKLTASGTRRCCPVAVALLEHRLEHGRAGAPAPAGSDRCRARRYTNAAARHADALRLDTEKARHDQGQTREQARVEQGSLRVRHPGERSSSSAPVAPTPPRRRGRRASRPLRGEACGACASRESARASSDAGACCACPHRDRVVDEGTRACATARAPRPRWPAGSTARRSSAGRRADRGCADGSWCTDRGRRADRYFGRCDRPARSALLEDHPRSAGRAQGDATPTRRLRAASAGASSQRSSTARSTSFISSSAKLAPRQRRRPPPKGIQV